MTTVVILLAVSMLLGGFLLGVMCEERRSKDAYKAELERNTIRVCIRMRQAMRSLNVDEESIDMVQERMTKKVMPPYIPSPTHELSEEKSNQQSKENE